MNGEETDAIEAPVEVAPTEFGTCMRNLIETYRDKPYYQEVVDYIEPTLKDYERVCGENLAKVNGNEQILLTIFLKTIFGVYESNWTPDVASRFLFKFLAGVVDVRHRVELPPQ